MLFSCNFRPSSLRRPQTWPAAGRMSCYRLPWQRFLPHLETSAICLPESNEPSSSAALFAIAPTYTFLAGSGELPRSAVVDRSGQQTGIDGDGGEV